MALRSGSVFRRLNDFAAGGTPSGGGRCRILATTVHDALRWHHGLIGSGRGNTPRANLHLNFKGFF
jgi:hypothetical protein